VTNSSLKPIYCIGDSHVSFFAGENTIQPNWPEAAEDILPFFRTFRLGAVLAYNLGCTRTTMRGYEKLWAILDTTISVGSDVLLCFGEIDCRAHLLKQSHRQNRPITSIVKECVERYVNVLTQVQNAGYQVIAWGPTPSSNEIISGNYPTYGTTDERNTVTALFNQDLSVACSAHGLRFATIFDRLVTENLQSRSDYYLDTIHISQRAMPLAIEALQAIMPEYPFATFDFSQPYYKLSHSRIERPAVRAKSSGVRRMKKVLRKIKSRFISTPRPESKREISPVFDLGFHGDQYLLNLVENLMGNVMAFIETGANVGSTAHYVASHYPHLQVYACEPDKAAFAKAQETTSSDMNIHLYQMLSPDFLYQLHQEKPNLRQTLNLYWLDAHDYGFQWPLYDEIRYITETMEHGIILVDDAQVPTHPDLFRYCAYDGQECNLDYIKSALASNQRYRVFYPAYTEHTSPHHPLIGTMGILFGTVPVEESIFEHFELIEVAK
jgi:hypothetical protein